MRLIDADALIEFCAERWIPLNIDAVNMQPTIQPEKAQHSQQGVTSDTISRQEVIDLLKQMRKDGDMVPWEGKDVFARIRKLPSARSELQWIPISDRLPRDGSWNIFTDGKNISAERYKEDAIDHFFPNGRWFQLEDAIAWMPLPEAYKSNK